MAVKSGKDSLSVARFRAALNNILASTRQKREDFAKSMDINYGTLTSILNGSRPASIALMDEVAKKLNCDLAVMLSEGRRLLGDTVEPLPNLPTTPEPLTDEELRQQGFIKVPFSDNMKLAAGGGGTIPITEDAENSVVIVHGPSLKRHTAKNLQAFRVGGDSMEPLIAKGGIVMADIAPMFRDIMHIHEGDIYILCWDLSDGECAVKYLRWAEKGRLLSIESEMPYVKPVYKAVEDVVLIGKVIWAWREF